MESARTQGILLLHFDDHAAVRGLVSECLRGVGITVDSVADLEQAQIRLGQTVYAGLITDLDPGSGDPSKGLQFLRWARQEHPDLPILVLTGANSETVRAQAREIGVLDFLVKPQPLAKLAKAVARMLEAASPAVAS